VRGRFVIDSVGMLRRLAALAALAALAGRAHAGVCHDRDAPAVGEDGAVHRVPEGAPGRLMRGTASRVAVI
jgi:hypothetical protein